jgi:hypothetical protein
MFSTAVGAGKELMSNVRNMHIQCQEPFVMARSVLVDMGTMQFSAASGKSSHTRLVDYFILVLAKV